MALHVYPGIFWLPGLETAGTQEVPDDAWQGWEWPSGVNVLGHAERAGDADAHATAPGAVPRRGRGRPMRAQVLGPGDAGWAGGGYVVEVHGFLDERTALWAQAVGGTPERRATLLAVVCTLEIRADKTAA